MKDLSSRTQTPVLEVCSLNHWTTREVSHMGLLSVTFHRTFKVTQVGVRKHNGLLRHYYQVCLGKSVYGKMHINAQNTLWLILLTVHNQLTSSRLDESQLESRLPGEISATSDMQMIPL